MTRPGRVLVVTNDFPPRAGGIETYVDALVGRLDPERVVVHACAQDGAAEHDRGLPYPVVRDPARLLLPGPGLSRRVRETARRHGADAVWFPSAAPLALLAPGLRRAGVRTVVASAHGHEVWWARLPGARCALRALGEGVDVVTVDSAAVRRPVSRGLGAAAAGRVVLLSPGVDADRFAAPRPPGGDDPLDGPVVLCVSRAVPRKGHARLLDLWPEVRRRHPAARLVLAGGGPELERLRHRAQDLPGVQVLGRVDDDRLPALYAAADLFVLPVADRLAGLVTESLGIVLLEAAAAGLPVVSGRAGGTVDAVLHGRTGLLVDASDRDQLLGSVETYLSDPGRRRRDGTAGQEWVRAAWTWDRTARRLEALLAGEPVDRW
ncbi:glycosyltransferase family 4 protein [Aquipuribacter hungaricus]|uniref:D-inositol 3-phosphate glycosyltransferase n=1 Tax=Aquipuribacter hungaricus TaxID=545624 RepID=A0ABV7WHN0_9MICO